MAKFIRVETTGSAYRKTMPFNRYSFEKIDGFLVMQFGFLAPAGTLLDFYACAISEFELENQKKSIMEYLGKAGALGDGPPAWQPPIGKSMDLCNHIGLCGSPKIGEITLNNMAARELSEVKPSHAIVKADTIALLRSSMEIHKHWLKDLYK
jgi:hypothetical protein